LGACPWRIYFVPWPLLFLFASWKPWGEQLYSTVCSCHDALPYYSPPNQWSQAAMETSETMSQNKSLSWFFSNTLQQWQKSSIPNLKKGLAVRKTYLDSLYIRTYQNWGQREDIWIVRALHMFPSLNYSKRIHSSVNSKLKFIDLTGFKKNPILWLHLQTPLESKLWMWWQSVLKGVQRFWVEIYSRHCGCSVLIFPHSLIGLYTYGFWRLLVVSNYNDCPAAYSVDLLIRTSQKACIPQGA
jgi:hypothetical protein